MPRSRIIVFSVALVLLLPLAACGKSPEDADLKEADLGDAWQSVPVRLIKVIDGDTLEVVLDGKPTRVRLLEIDTPEMNTAEGQAVKGIVEKILAGKKITLVHQNNKDSYDRLLGHIIVEGHSLSDMILQEINSLAKKKGVKFVGSRNSSKYHYPNCKWVKMIEPKNRITFDSVKAAQAWRYVPCKVCKPPASSKD